MKKPIRLSILLLCLTFAACNSTKNNEKDAEAFIERSASYEEQGQYRAAMIEIRNAIQATPDKVDAKLKYAELLLTVGAVRQAIEVLTPIETNDGKVLLADAYLRLGKHVSATEALNEATPSSVQYDLVPILKAKAEFLRGNPDKAINNLESIAEKTPDNVRAMKELIPLLIASRKLDEAKKWIAKALTINADDPEILYSAAEISYLQDDLTGAETKLTKALVELPDTDLMLNIKQKTLELMSKVLTDLGRSSEALVYNKVIQNANPEAFSARQQYQDALKAASNGDLETAKGAFEDILTQFPNNQQAALLLGLISLETGQLEEGEALLSENLDAEIAPTSLIQTTALAQAELGKAESALNVVERALLARPDDPTLLSLYGVISLNSGKQSQGIEAISKALQLAPDRSRLHLLLAQYYNQNKQPELALGHLRKAFNITPTDWSTTLYYIDTLFAQNEANEITKVRDELQKTYPSNATPMWLVALINYRNGDLETAKNQLKALYEQNKSINDISTSYASLLDQMQDYDTAADVWMNALNNDPSEKKHIESAIRSKSKTTSGPELISWLKTQKQAYPEARLPIDAGLIQLYVMSGQPDVAVEISNDYRTNDQPLAKQMQVVALQGMALNQASQQDFKAALDDANKALKVQPSNQSLAILAGQFEARAESKEAALSRFKKFIDANEENDNVVAEATKLLISMQGDKAAYDFIQPFWAKKPSGELATVYLTLTKKIVSTRYEDAVDELLEAEPNNAGGNLIKGDLALADNKEANALAHYQQAVKSNPNLVPALNNLAWLIAKDNPSQAIQYSSRAVELAPNNAAILDTHGWIQHLNGNKKEAISTLKKALELAPDNAEIKEHLRKVQS